jgi:ATP-binding cassette subfamily B protein RaxB
MHGAAARPEPSPLLSFWQRRRLPVLLQSEAAECGLACLAMVAAYWGHRSDLPGLRERFAISLKGATLKGLIAMAQALMLQARPLKLELAELGGLQLPCVLHWDMNHFVVLQRVGRRGIVIHDPAVGRRELSLEEASKHFTGVALELSPSADFAPIEAARPFTLRSLMGRVSGLRRGLAQLLLLGIALQVCALIAPFYLQWTVDEALVSADADLLTVLGLGFGLLVLVQAAIGAVRSWVTTVLSTQLGFQWMGQAFAHLMKLPLAYFEKRHLGDVVSRFGSLQTIQKALTTQLVEAVIDGLLVIATATVMLLYSPSLTAVAAAAVALYAGLRWALYRGLREANAEQIVHAAQQQTHLLESVRGAAGIRLFGREQERRIGWLNRLAEQSNAELRIARLSISYNTAQSWLFGTERVLVVWLAALAVLDTRFSVGMLFAFLSYKDQFSQRLGALIDKLFELRMLRLHGERVADILLTPAEAEGPELERPVDVQAPEIELRGLGFRYAESEPWVLQQLNLRIPAGQCVAITGASGCGKTTLIKLLLGLLEPTQGEILVGGVPLRRLGLRHFRQCVGTVMQDDPLFTGSIGENIHFFDPSPDAARVEAAARQAALHADIAAMPMGYHTLLGDGGAGLSGGQKQRLLLARALYKQPRILVLDEATSHLDAGNEQRVNAAVRHLPLTRILVAHRLETIAMAQRVLVLEQGQLVRDLEQAEAQGLAA